MTRTVAVVCGSGVSSTFLARGIRAQLAERSLDWRVEPLSIDELTGRAAELDLVLVGHHLASSLDAVMVAVDGRVPTVVLEVAGSGTDAAIAAVAHLADFSLGDGAPASDRTPAPAQGENHG